MANPGDRPTLKRADIAYEDEIHRWHSREKVNKFTDTRNGSGLVLNCGLLDLHFAMRNELTLDANIALIGILAMAGGIKWMKWHSRSQFKTHIHFESDPELLLK
jgi:hypothetical protein